MQQFSFSHNRKLLTSRSPIHCSCDKHRLSNHDTPRCPLISMQYCFVCSLFCICSTNDHYSRRFFNHLGQSQLILCVLILPKWCQLGVNWVLNLYMADTPCGIFSCSVAQARLCLVPWLLMPPWAMEHKTRAAPEPAALSKALGAFQSKGN